MVFLAVRYSDVVYLPSVSDAPLPRSKSPDDDLNELADLINLRYPALYSPSLPDPAPEAQSDDSDVPVPP